MANPKRTILPSSPMLQPLQPLPLRLHARLPIEILLRLLLLVRRRIQRPDEIGVETDHFRLEFVEEAANFGFLTLFFVFVGV